MAVLADYPACTEQLSYQNFNAGSLEYAWAHNLLFVVNYKYLEQPDNDPLAFKVRRIGGWATTSG
jgi:hypothetical protein